MYGPVAFLCALSLAVASAQLNGGGSLSVGVAPISSAISSGSAAASSALNSTMSMGAGLFGRFRQMASDMAAMKSNMVQAGTDRMKSQINNAASIASAIPVVGSFATNGANAMNSAVDMANSAVQSKITMLSNMQSMKLNRTEEIFKSIASAIDAGIKLGESMATQGLASGATAAQTGLNAAMSAAGQASTAASTAAQTGLNAAMSAAGQASTAASTAAQTGLNAAMSAAGQASTAAMSAAGQASTAASTAAGQASTAASTAGSMSPTVGGSVTATATV